MIDVAKNIFDYSKSNNIINSKFIYNITLNLINILKLNDYIKSIKIGDLNSNTLARYLIDEKRLCIDIKKMIYYVATYINQITNYSYENKILLTNLYIIKILFHELEHAFQEKKIQSTDNYETRILTLSSYWEDKIKKDNFDFYNNYKYLYNPIERQANIVSTRRIIELSKILYSKEILDFFYNEYLNQALHGYNEKDFDYPLLNFFYGNLELLKTIESIEKYKVFSFKERINLGLEITEDEYYFLKDSLDKMILKKK